MTVMFFHEFSLWCRNFFFPHRCVFCRRRLHLSADLGVCPDCMEKIPFCLDSHRCQACGRPVPEGETLCLRCHTGFRNHYRKVCAAYLYEDIAKESILRFKRARYQTYAPVFAAHMAAALQNNRSFHGADLIVAVPPRKERMRKEGYDQIRFLAGNLARQMKIPFLYRVLRQVENRQKQSSLSYEERWRNVRGNYKVVRKKAVDGKRILLVDDICTTGATLNECAKMLKESGAMEVFCVVAAVATQEKSSSTREKSFQI